jgi:Ca-activated chloride channel family protein
MNSRSDSSRGFLVFLQRVNPLLPVATLAAFIGLSFSPMLPTAAAQKHEEVRLFISVTDSKGNPVESLTEKDFQLKENDQPMAIQSLKFQRNTPVSLGILIDISRSMGTENTKLALQLVESLAKIMKSPDELFVMAFSEEAELVVDFISPEDYLEEALDHLGTGGPTYTALAVDRGLAKLREARNPRRILLVFSAGRDKAGPATMEHIGRFQLPIYSLQFPGTGGITGAYDSLSALNIRGSALKSYAEQSGGRTEAIDQMETALPPLKKYYQDWKNPYLLQYTSPNVKQDGKFRKISLEALNNPVEILHLKKYFIPLNRRTPLPPTQVP